MVINARRFLYNKDGTTIGMNTDGLPATGVTSWLSQAEMDTLQSETGKYMLTTQDSKRTFFMFFPTKRNVEYLGILLDAYGTSYFSCVIEVSDDSTDGSNGTWTTIPFSESDINIARQDIGVSWWASPKELTAADKALSVSVLRITLIFDYLTSEQGLFTFHVYGRELPGENPDDIIFVQSDATTPMASLLDMGDVPEGGSAEYTTYVKNNSSSLTANTISLEMGGEYSTGYEMSFDGTTWANTPLSIASLAPAEQVPLYVRFMPGAAPQELNSRYSYVNVTVGSWA